MLKNAYLLANVGDDTAENDPIIAEILTTICQNFDMGVVALLPLSRRLLRLRGAGGGGSGRPSLPRDPGARRMAGLNARNQGAVDL